MTAHRGAAARSLVGRRSTVPVDDVRSLAGRPWSALWEAMEGLRFEKGDGWQALE